MKSIKWTIAIVTILILGYLAYSWWDNRNYFERGQTGRFSIEVGESFQFKLPENGSTGYQNCWINSHQCANVEFIEKAYTNNLSSRLGNVGAGGYVAFKFRGIKKGLDTIAIASCGTGQEQKDCSQYSIDSVAPENLMIVEVR